MHACVYTFYKCSIGAFLVFSLHFMTQWLRRHMDPQRVTHSQTWVNEKNRVLHRQSIDDILQSLQRRRQHVFFPDSLNARGGEKKGKKRAQTNSVNQMFVKRLPTVQKSSTQPLASREWMWYYCWREIVAFIEFSSSAVNIKCSIFPPSSFIKTSRRLSAAALRPAAAAATLTSLLTLLTYLGFIEGMHNRWLGCLHK